MFAGGLRPDFFDHLGWASCIDLGIRTPERTKRASEKEGEACYLESWGT